MNGSEEQAERVRAPREGDVVRRLPDPKSPTQAEIDLHNLMGHIPYRNWCPAFVKAQGKDWGHSRDKGKERQLPEYS